MSRPAFEYERGGWAWWLILLLVVLHTANLANSSSVVDTARDLYNAWRIAGEGEIVMQGPVLAGVLHAGPIWFYLLSVPMWFSESWLYVALWAGFLAALKYPLAFVIGRELHSVRLGVLFAGALALPGWPSLWLVISHVSLVETATLAIAASAVFWLTRRQMIWLLLLPVAMAAGLHAHPTVFIAAVITGLAVLPSFRRQPGALRAFLFGCLLGSLLFAPYIVQQAWTGWPDLASSGGYLSNLSLLDNLARFPDVVFGAVWNGPQAAVRQMQMQPLAALLMLWAVRFVVLYGLSSALVQSLGVGRNAALVRWAWMMWILTFAFVATIRDFTPGYMIFVTLPLTAWLIAVGWLPGFRAQRQLLLSFVVLGLALTFAGNYQTSQGQRTEYPNKWLRDIGAKQPGWTPEVLHFPAYARSQLAAWLCASRTPVTLHGYASVVLEQSYAMEMRMRCGEGSGLFLAGENNPGQHWLGMHAGDAKELRVTGGEKIGSLVLIPVQKVYRPGHAVSVPKGDSYPPRKFLRGNEKTLLTKIKAVGKQWVAVSNAYVVWNPAKTEMQLDGGGEVQKVEGLLSDFYRCADCLPTQKVEWHLEVSAPAPQYVEAVVFELP